MAKTTSQIIAENQVKRAEAAAVGAQLSKIHQQQMAQVGSKNATRTAAVLENAIAGTTGASQKKSLELAYSNIVKDAKKNGVQIRRSTPRDEQIALKNAPETKKQTRDRTKKEYDDYVKSDEYKKRVTENDQKARAEAAAQMFLNPGQPMPQPKVIQDEREMQLRASMEQAEKEYNDAENQKVIESDLEAITGLSEDERRQLEQYATGRDVDYYESLNFAQNGDLLWTQPMGRAEKEAAALIEKYGKERVDEMANSLSWTRNEKIAGDVEAKGKEQANNGFWSAAGASAATIPAGILAGIGGVFDFAKDIGRNDTRFTTLDPNAMGNLGNIYSGAVRGQVAQNISGDVYDEETGQKIKDGGFLRELGSVGYQDLMSWLDNIARAAIGGSTGGAALAATGSFSQTMASASKQGASPAEAAFLATVNSGIEAATEKIPLDDLLDIAKGGAQPLKQALKTALKQAGVEAATEELSLIGTTIMEMLTLREKSSYIQEINEAIVEGVKPEDAIKQANDTLRREAVNTLFVSMFSGAASSLTGSYAAKRGLFAQEQEQNNPALNQPKQSDVVKSVEDLRQKYGQPEAQQAAEQPQQAAAPAVEAQTTQTTEQAAQAPQQPQEAPRTKQSTVIDSVVETIQRNGGNVTNRMAENVMSDPTAMQKLGITPEGTKAEQRRRVKEEMEKLFQTQNQTDETAANVLKTEPMQATETNEQATRQASAPQTDMQMGASNQSAESGQQTQTQQPAPEMQRDRINAVREQEVTVTDRQGGKVSEFAGNAYQSSLTPDSFTDSIKRLVEEGQVSHDVQTNEESLRKGAEMIAKAGTERKAVNEIRDFANSGKFTPEHIAMGTLLYQDLTAQIDQQAKNGNVDTNLQQDAEDVFVSLQQMATNSGRALQLYNLFRKMTPESQVNVLEREVQRNIEKMQKAGTVKKGYQSSIDPELTNMYRQAADEFQKAKGADAKKFAEQKMQDIQSVIYASEAAKLPTTFKAKWDAWRYMAMLGNAKTQIRNLIGNTAMIPYTGAKRKIGALLEHATIRDKSKRTKSLTQDRELLEWAKNDRNDEHINKTLKDSAKLVDSKGGNPLQDDVKTFGDKKIGEMLNKLQKKIGDVTSWGDMIYKNREYARSLAGFLKARGYTAADVQNNLVSQDVLNEARNYALNEALRATFNDSNQLSDWFSSVGRKEDSNVFGKAMNLALEGVIPFRKTPANVLARGWEYSPMGIFTTIYNTGRDIHNGEYSAATAIDRLSANLTGSAMFALGYALAEGMGNIKLRGGDVDEDEERAGVQKNALEVTVNGETYSYTIDWLAPANLPLIMGVNMHEYSEDPDTASFVTACMNVGLKTLEPMLELSCLSGLNDFIASVRYAEDGEEVYTLLAKAATSYFTQGIPSIARQTTQALTENKQTTFTTSGDEVISSAQKTVAGLGVGTPYKTDKRNAWGEKEVQGEALSSITGLPVEVTRAIDAFFNPGTLKKIDNSAVEQEIARLNKAGHDVTPDTAARTISYVDKDGQGHDDVRLTEEQYQTLAETQGQTARKLVEDMVKSKAYQALTDEQKSEALDEAYLYARKTGEIAAIGESHTGYDQSWMYDVNKGGGANELMRRVFNSSLNTSMSDLSDAWEKGYNEETFSRDMEEAYDSYQKAPAAMKRQVYEEASGTEKRYMEARDKGLTHKEVISAIENVVKVHGTGAVNKETGKPKVRDIDERQAIAKTPGISDSAKDILIKSYMGDYDPNASKKEYSELKYNYIREKLGLSPEEYAEVYRAVLDEPKDKKDDDVVRALGYDQAIAKQIADVFNSTKSGKKAFMDWYEKNK